MRDRRSPTSASTSSSPSPSSSGASAREKWTADLFGRFANAPVAFQTRDSASRTVTTQESTLEELVEAAFQSSHTRSHFLLDEEVLANAPELAEQLALPKYVCVALLFVCVCLCL